MESRLLRITFVFQLLAALFALSAPAIAAENATITGDKVNVRVQPAVWEKTWGTLDKGTRVEAVYVSDFTDTVDGYTAPWYYIECGDGLLSYGNSGFVFGRYIALGPGATVPPLTRNICQYVDPIERFIQRGLHSLGINEADITNKLGRPVSVTEYKSEMKYSPLGYVFERRLTYKDIVIEIRRETKTGPDDIHRLSITTGAYECNGLKVGSTVADVERVLGTSGEKTGESLIYRDGSMGVHEAVFKLRDGVVTGITFDTTYSD
jgi:hypothetical protein